jgi:hypothetical protein
MFENRMLKRYLSLKEKKIITPTQDTIGGTTHPIGQTGA